jgi:predicted small lipoprotein YifL
MKGGFRTACVLAALAVAAVAGCGSSSTTGNGDGGGAGTGGGASCADLEAQYTSAFAAASACTVGVAGQCAQLASSTLSPCFVDCMTYVQNPTALDALKSRWTAAGCGQKVTVCPAIACLKPTAGSCAAGDGGAGMCVSAAPFGAN